MSASEIREFRIQLLVLSSKKANFVILHLCLKSLHWLPVNYHIDFKVLLLTFKSIHGLAPPYISERIPVKDMSGRYSLRSNNGGNF